MSHGDFDSHELATYLHLTPDQVLKLAERSKLPGRKVGGQWRFSQAEVHHWLEDRIGVSTDEELERIESQLGGSAGDEEISIDRLLPVEAIAIPLAARTRSSAIAAMVELASQTGWLWDPEKMQEAVRAREDLYPTVSDGGVALLHPRRPLASILAQPFLAFGRTERGIPFAGGGELTDLFFLVLSVDDRGHLRTLARLSRLVGNAAFRAELRACENAAAVQRAIADFEQGLAKD